LLKNIFFILFLVACNLFNSSNSINSIDFIDGTYEELNSIVHSSLVFIEDFAEETEKDDSSKHLMLFASDFTIIKTKSKEKNIFINSTIINKNALLNSYIDLPPPGNS
jgi:hypothetical protein